MIFTRNSLAAHLNVSLRTIDTWIKEGTISYIRKGKLIRFLQRDIESALVYYESQGQDIKPLPQGEFQRFAEQFVTRKSLSELFQISVRQVDYWIQKRRVPFRRCGGILRFKISEVIDCFDVVNTR